MKRKIALLIIISMLTVVLGGCKVTSMGTLAVNLPVGDVMAESVDFASAASVLSAASSKPVTVDLLEKIGQEKTAQLLDLVDNGAYSEKSWLEVTGYSLIANYDIANGTVLPENVRDYGYNGKDYFDVSFVGDVNYDPDCAPMVRVNELGGVENCFDTEVLDALRGSDITLMNNEFSITERGSALEGKTWTFRAHPDTVQIHKDLGADIVSLANNHVYDYGETGFQDTLAHLEAAGMPYVGAGRNLDEAKQAQYFIVNGIKVGIIAASRAEKVYFTPVATDDSAGIMGTYESAEFLDAIKESDAQCDILIAYVHWGTERSTKLESAQKEMAREYIDAGADAVIGAHTHCLQGMEFYNGKPVVYSMSNFWFSNYLSETGILTLRIDNAFNVQTNFMPLIQQNGEVRCCKTQEERRALFDKVAGYEPQGVSILDDGTVLPS